LLDAAGWPLRRGRRATAFRTEEKATAPGPADYALWLGDRIVGIVEAHATAHASRKQDDVPAFTSAFGAATVRLRRRFLVAYVEMWPASVERAFVSAGPSGQRE
jgi:hypothetical protein